jgi:hypothetical protein
MAHPGLRAICRAFSPLDSLGGPTWAFGPGWYIGGPSALGAAAQHYLVAQRHMGLSSEGGSDTPVFVARQKANTEILDFVQNDDLEGEWSSAEMQDIGTQHHLHTDQ